jgi:chromosome segregation protein
VRESEVSLAKALAEQARADAELRVADAALTNAQARVERAARDAARLAEEQGRLGDEADLTAAKQAAEQAVASFQQQTAEGLAALETVEAHRASLIAARDAAQSAFASAKAELAALQSEQSALARALTKNGGAQAIDFIKAEPGYERALAAALGEDVNAAIGGEQGRRWLGRRQDVPTLSGTRLIDHVEAPEELRARLSMIRVVDTDDGEALNPGERIVTRDGKVRRWDGFTADDDGATTAEQLIRQNRLKVLEDQIPVAQRALAQQAEDAEHLAAQIAQTQERHRDLMSAQQKLDGELRQSLRATDQAEDALNRLHQARAALQERIAASEQDMAVAKAELEDAQKMRAALPAGDHHMDLVEKLTAENDALRHLLVRSQADLSAHDQRLAQTRERRAVAMAEIRGWQDRAGEAERRIAEMNKRAAEIAQELESLTGRPEVLEQDIARLDVDRESIAEKLAQLQVAENNSEAALKSLEGELATAAEALSIARETRAGAEARAENQDQRRIEMGRISGERFECPPPVLPEKLEFDETELGDATVQSGRLERLQGERERIGPVNLIAADELAELEEQQGTSLKESEELTQAIHQLRGSIGSLNREGRARLLTAFEAVDGHFRRLFSTLFNGGQAHLALIDSDDPLEAGLEIFAQPPGKKLQSLTLLSGGEQALTAVALIFGLFLTNPAPICVLDEVDAPLDDANIERFCDLLDAMTQETDTRYLIVTHNAVTMSRMHRLFGVTMVEQGISRLVSVDLGGAEQLLAAE